MYLCISWEWFGKDAIKVGSGFYCIYIGMAAGLGGWRRKVIKGRIHAGGEGSIARIQI